MLGGNLFCNHLPSFAKCLNRHTEFYNYTVQDFYGIFYMSYIELLVFILVAGSISLTGIMLYFFYTSFWVKIYSENQLSFLADGRKLLQWIRQMLECVG